MSEENKELLRRWVEEVWNKGRAEAIEGIRDHGLDVNGKLNGLADTNFHAE